MEIKIQRPNIWWCETSTTKVKGNIVVTPSPFMLSDVYVMSHDSGEQLHSEIWVRNLNIACVVSDCLKRSRGGKQTSDLSTEEQIWMN